MDNISDPHRTRTAAILRDRAAGSLLGCAIGDAVGEIAFRLPDRDALRQALARDGTLIYTDDTAMAIALAEALAEQGGIDARDLGDRFAAHYAREPWRGYGAGPPRIFGLAQRGDRGYVEIARTLYGGEGSLGNGAAMRAAPLGIAYRDRAELRAAAERAAEVTHAHPIGRDSCAVQALAVGIALRHALDGQRLDPAATAQRLLEACATAEMREKMQAVRDLLAEDAPAERVADAVGRSLAAHESVPFAIHAFLAATDDYEACLDIAILNGGDRDTLGAMAGSISGAYLGERALPADWRDRVENAEMLRALAQRLADAFPAAG